MKWKDNIPCVVALAMVAVLIALTIAHCAGPPNEWCAMHRGGLIDDFHPPKKIEPHIHACPTCGQACEHRDR